MSSKPSSALIPALNLVANMAGLYPPLSALPLAVSILTSIASSTTKSPSPQATAGANTALCMFCGNRPRYIENGRVLEYCGKTCADSARAVAPASLKSVPPVQNCLVCGSKPRFHDGQKLHDYCGKRCAGMVRSGAKANSPGKAIMISQPQTCEIPGCKAPAYQDKNGTVSKHCSKSHTQLSKEACLMCRKVPMRIGQFCGRLCSDNAENSAPRVLEIPEGHITFKSDQFTSTWKAAKPCPAVRRIYKIAMTKASMSKYEAYKSAIEAKGNFKTAGRALGNENRRWHGTTRLCTFGDPGNTQPCSHQACALCCIVKVSFDITKLKNGSYGAGIYSSATSSKSDSYSTNKCASNLKAMMLNKVVVGKGAKSGYSSAMTAPPPGYDSVIVDNPGQVNDELVVFTNDAIRPAYLLMYDA